MTIVKTEMRQTADRARLERFEPTGSLTQTNVQKAIEQVHSQPPAIGANTTALTSANSPYVPLLTDTFLAIDTAGGAITINLGAASLRNGMPLTIKDTTGHANANNITINRNGADTIDALTAFTLSADFGGVRLVPITGGYTVDA